MQQQDHLKNGWNGLNDVKCNAKSETKNGFLKFTFCVWKKDQNTQMVNVLVGPTRRRL